MVWRWPRECCPYWPREGTSCPPLPSQWVFWTPTYTWTLTHSTPILKTETACTPKCGQHCPHLHSAKSLQQNQHQWGTTTNTSKSVWLLIFLQWPLSYSFISQLELGTSSINLGRPTTWGQRQSQSPKHQKKKRMIMSKKLIILVIYYCHELLAPTLIVMWCIWVKG